MKQTTLDGYETRHSTTRNPDSDNAGLSHPVILGIEAALPKIWQAQWEKGNTKKSELGTKKQTNTKKSELELAFEHEVET